MCTIFQSYCRRCQSCCKLSFIIDITCNTIGKSYTHGLLTTIGQMVISNRLCIWDKTSDVDPIICTGATCKQPICTSASPRYRLVVCRWLLYRLLDRRLRFCHRFSHSAQTKLVGEKNWSKILSTYTAPAIMSGRPGSGHEGRFWKWCQSWSLLLLSVTLT